MVERKRYLKTFQKKKKGRILIGLKILFFIFLVFLLGGAFLFIYYAKDLPRPEKFTERPFPQSTKIYDRSGEHLLYEVYGEEKRTLVSLDVIPDYLEKAVVAVEDADFYHHFGVDFKGIIRAVLADLQLLKPAYGGSTIPQQLIRSAFLTTEKTAERKIREIVLSLELDRRYPKEQILEWYLNQVPFGSNCYGVEAASQTYFKKSVSEVSLEEAAVLAALIKAPSHLSPYGSYKIELLGRKDYVLDRMAEENFISQTEADKTKEEEIEFAKILQPIEAPHFTLWVKELLEEKYSDIFLREKGLKVYTSLDWELQKLAEKVVEEGAEINHLYYNAHNAALVALDPETGEILALVGSKDYFDSPYPEGCSSGVDCLFDPQFNAVVGTKDNPGRQPGSAFKPFVYATAFNKGYSDQTVVIDEETNFGLWGNKEYIPQNYDGLFRGPVTLRQALAQSINVPSVKVLLNFAGLPDSIETAEKLGITTLKPPFGPSIVLGGWEVKLLEMVSAYGVFATEGLKVPPIAILKIEDQKGNIVEINEKSLKRVLPSQTCQLINDILSDNEARAPMFGARSALFFEEHQVAAKTGTTQDFRDAWAIGYTSSLVTGVWVGNNNNASMAKKPAVTLAGPIFHNFMEAALESMKFASSNLP